MEYNNSKHTKLFSKHGKLIFYITTLFHKTPIALSNPSLTPSFVFINSPTMYTNLEPKLHRE